MSAVVKLGINSAEPLYRAARNRLLEALASGDYSPGHALPPEKDLAAEFGISIGTLRKAVDELVSEGILIRQQGRGTFVASHDRERLMYYFFHVVPFDRAKTEYPVVELVSFARGKADQHIADKLQIKTGDPIFKMRNQLSLAGQTVMIDDIALPSHRFSGLTAEKIRKRSSTIYQLYQAQFGLTVAHTEERLRAVSAPSDIAALLQVAPNSPVLMIRRLASGYQREPIEWRVSHVDTRSHEYLSESVV
ncbi:MAG: GntR family transcriptional regulator [Burkholderiaceae bacterium]